MLVMGPLFWPTQAQGRFKLSRLMDEEGRARRRRQRQMARAEELKGNNGVRPYWHSIVDRDLKGHSAIPHGELITFGCNAESGHSPLALPDIKRLRRTLKR